MPSTTVEPAPNDIVPTGAEMQALFLTSLGDMIRPYFENQSHEWVCIMEKPVEPISLIATINARLKNKDGQIA